VSFYVLFISIIYVTILYLIHEYSIPMRYGKNTRVFKKYKFILNIKNKNKKFCISIFFIIVDSIKLLLVSFIRFKHSK